MSARRRTAIYATLLFLALFAGCNALIAPLVYFAEPIHGKVVDAHTLEPLEGVVVVVEWIPYALIFVDRAKPMMVLETVTDAEGRYAFPSWGPRPRHLTEHLTYLDPQVIFFRSGYKPRIESNNRHRNTWVRSSDWSTVSIELERFHGTAETRLEQLGFILEEAGIGSGHLDTLFDEMLKEAPLSAAGAKPFFEGIGELRRKGL